MLHQAHPAEHGGNYIARRPRDDVGSGEIARGHQYRATARRQRGEHLVDIARRDQWDVRQDRTYFGRARRYKRRGREPDRGIEAARVLLVDRDRMVAIAGFVADLMVFGKRGSTQ